MTNSKMKNIAVLCSGGDSPGMNCAVRAVVRTAVSEGLKVFGVVRGYQGLLEGNFIPMDVSSVGNIMQRGGTILETSRCPEFKKPEIRKEAANILKRKKIDGLIVIGGNGSFNGAWKLYEEHKIPIIGIPGTIDNDISNSDYSIGFDTAVQTAIDAVDKIRDTAHSHARSFIVEVMGRSSSAIAMHVGVCTGAENIIFPNKDINFEEIASDIKRGENRGKNSSIIICAEGKEPGLSYRIQQGLKEKYDHDTHVCILGHIQRGGNPSGLDRFIASRMGYVAVDSLLKGQTATATAFQLGEVQAVPLENCLEKKVEYLPHVLKLIKTLSI